MHYLKKLKKGKTGREPLNDPQQPPKEQKDPLLHNKLSSDADPLHQSLSGFLIPPSLTDFDAMDPAQRKIALSNGNLVEQPSILSPGPQQPTSPLSGLFLPQMSGPPPPFPTQGRSPYDLPRGSGLGASFDYPDPMRPIESAQQAATYDNLLKEAQILRRDLEREYSLNRGSEEEVNEKIHRKKLELADAQRNSPSANVYDDIIVSLSQELVDLEKKVKQIEARMSPLDRAVADLKDVETFITDRELDSDGAMLLFEEIMKKLFEDINIGGNASGEAVASGHLPKAVLDEMKGQMMDNTFRKSDPVEATDETPAWVDFNSDGGNREKITATGGYEEQLRKKRNKDKFSRVSRKMSDLTEFTQKKSPGRTEAFRFHAVDRSDAFKNPSYYPEEPALYKTGAMLVPYATSVTSDQKSTTSELIEKVEVDLWMGYNQSAVIMTPAPSDAPESMKSAKSIPDLHGLDQHPAVMGDTGLGDKEGTSLMGQQRIEGMVKTAAAPMLQDVASTSSQKPPIPLGNETRMPTSVPKMEETSEVEPESEASGSRQPKKAVKKESEEESGGGMAEALTKVQLKKPTEKPQGQQLPAVGMDTDLAVLAATVMGAASAESKANAAVKLDLNVEEPPPPPKKPAAKPPPPPPKKAPPPPPPPKKKGGPPPPPGRKAGAKPGGPPPPPGGRKKAGDGLKRAPEVIAMFQEMRKALLGNAANASSGPKKIGGDNASADPGALMEELAKNSKYAMQVQADIVNYGPVIQDLTKQVSGFEADKMQTLVEFVNRVDGVLAELSDETAVLKQFEWPARYYTMLESKHLYLELENMKKMFKNWKQTAKTKSEELKNIQKFMDKSKNRVDVILRSKDADEKKFKENKIPWNVKIYTEVKIASLSLLVLYMDIVLKEVDNVMKAAPEEESPKRAKAIEKSMGHLTGAINFSFKTHQFAGGFTESANTKFAEIASKTRALKSELAGTSS